MALDYKEIRKIEQHTIEILNRFSIVKPPVPVKDIAQKLGLRVLPFDFDDDVSGILVIKSGQGTIGYNPKNIKQRRRFTIAHELGHFLLHNNAVDEVFIDKDFIVKYRSDKQYTQAEVKQEQAANSFAASLLMPKELIRIEVKRELYRGLSETQFIEKLAKTFDVSVPAMSFRSANLDLFNW